MARLAFWLVAPRSLHEARPRQRELSGPARAADVEAPVIHHLSIPATDTRHVAEVLVELLGGTLTPFGPYPDSWIAWAGDEHGAAIEVYPVGTEMYPDPKGSQQARFRHNPDATRYTATHATVSVDRTTDEVLAIAAREGWTAIPLSRGPFDVIEFWVENAAMLEIMTPEMVDAYLAAVPRRH